MARRRSGERRTWPSGPRSKKLSPEEVQAGTFTITNHGAFGSTPIIQKESPRWLFTGRSESGIAGSLSQDSWRNAMALPGGGPESCYDSPPSPNHQQKIGCLAVR
ncbi:MAG: 2-oxo acid dehydrogenase subunit E2 [Nitrospiraceae bacterium]